MHTTNTTFNTTPNGEPVHVELEDEVVDGVEVFTSLYLYIHHCWETGNVSVIGGELDDDLYLGGEADGFRVEGDLEIHAERAIVSWLAETIRGEEIVDEALENHCLAHEEARLDR